MLPCAFRVRSFGVSGAAVAAEACMGSTRRVNTAQVRRAAVLPLQHCRRLPAVPSISCSICCPQRCCHIGETLGGNATAANGSSSNGNSSSGRGGSRGAGGHTMGEEGQTPFDQFQSQRKAFHRHSFHEKGSTHKRQKPAEGGGGGGGAEGSAGEETRGDYGYSGPEAGRSRAEEFGDGGGGGGSATRRERREMARSWENAFFGRVHFEEGMHDRFQKAIDAEESERIAGKTNAELFPDWPPDEDAPPHLFKKLSPALQLRYILNRLSMGERRIRYAPDYGSLSMMYQLNLGETMVREAERLLEELGWMSEELQEKIDEVKTTAIKVKYDYDLD